MTVKTRGKTRIYCLRVKAPRKYKTRVRQAIRFYDRQIIPQARQELARLERANTSKMIVAMQKKFIKTLERCRDELYRLFPELLEADDPDPG